MKKNLVYLVIICFVVSCVAGCSSAQKKRDEEVKGIKSRVDSLESKVEGVETKQVETEKSLAQQAEMAAQKAAVVETNVSVKPREYKTTARIKDIQVCLKNAGYYDGAVDGVKGKMTRKAVKEFQKANGLTADGVVGKKTWELLSKYSKGSGTDTDIK